MNNNEFQTTYASSDPQVDALVENAFGKGLAATIMCSFPVASIIAISFGSTAIGMVDQARQMAAQRGVNISGKNIAAQILGKIGKIAGIVMTAFWAFYIFMLVIIMIAAL